MKKSILILSLFASTMCFGQTIQSINGKLYRLTPVDSNQVKASRENAQRTMKLHIIGLAAAKHDFMTNDSICRANHFNPKWDSIQASKRKKGH